jgi:hypothetical protein
VYENTQLLPYLYINILAMVGFSFILKGVPCRIEAFLVFDAHKGYIPTLKRMPLTLEFQVEVFVRVKEWVIWTIHVCFGDRCSYLAGASRRGYS